MIEQLEYGIPPVDASHRTAEENQFLLESRLAAEGVKPEAGWEGLGD